MMWLFQYYSNSSVLEIRHAYKATREPSKTVLGTINLLIQHTVDADVVNLEANRALQYLAQTKESKEREAVVCLQSDELFSGLSEHGDWLNEDGLPSSSNLLGH